MHPILNLTFETVRKASQYALQAQTRLDSVRIDIKDKQSFVSDIDINVQNMLIESIRDHLPECKIISEESEDNFDFDNAYEWLAVIDPIDGTHNYLKQIPYCCISIAFVKRNVRTGIDETQLAMVYDFNHDLLYHAEKGKGAFCNNKRIRVNQQKNLPFLHVDISHKLYADNPDIIHAFSENNISIRNFGAYALSLAHVASGKLDALVLGKKAKIWDVAAGSLLIQEAGGMLLPFNTRDRFDLMKPALNIAANPSVAALLQKLYQI